jgi:hypothetical protein
MLPDRDCASGPELDACRRLLIRCSGALSAEARRLQSLDLTYAVGGPCALALAAAAHALARDLLALRAEVEGQVDALRAATGG